MRLPVIYNDSNFQAWLNNINQDYYYQTKGIVSYVQNAGHRVVQSLRRHRTYKLTLDLGCGDGAHYPYLEEPATCFGIDIDRASLEKLQSRFPDFFVICADGYRLPLRDGSIDCIVNIYNLEHMVYLDLALEEMFRIIAPDGDIFISVPNVGGVVWDTGSILTSQRTLTTETMSFKRVVEISHINCIWQLEKAFKRYFTIKRKISFPFPIPSFHVNLITTYHCVKRSAC
jgi:SAM-dependent methyltransferase